MKTGNFCARLAVLPLALGCAPLSFAQATSNTAVPALKDVVVTATRAPQPLTDVVADVTVLDRDAIERSGTASLAEVLSRIPGFEMSRNGGPGTTTSVFVRGAESRFLAVYVDGIRMDSQSTGGASWEALPVVQIERIEVLRGPAAAVYGSDSLGGVVQIFTRKGDGAPAPYLLLGAATYGTTRVAAGVSGSDGQWDYSINAASDYSKGFNASTSPAANGDDDGYRLESYSARLGLKVNEAHRLQANIMASDLNSGYDSSVTKDDRNMKKLQAGALSWNAHWSEAYDSTVSVNNSQDRYETSPSVYLTKTNLTSYLWQNEFKVDQRTLALALERREDQLNNASTTPKDTEHFQNSLAGGYGWTDSIQSLQLNVRHDADSVFGTVNTGAVGYGVVVSPGWRVTGSAGTAFRAPTLFQRFSIYGSADLLAETSRNYELGIHRVNGPNTVDMTVYHNNVSNLITFLGNTGTCPSNLGTATGKGCYFNTAQARYKGITLSTRQVFDGFAMYGSLDLEDARDAVSEKFLVRRSMHHGVLGIDTNAKGWRWGTEVQASSQRYNDAANKVYLPGYVLLNLTAETRLNKDWKFLARVDNATDTQYELASGYATPGRSLYLGLKWAL
jgi:vitamin B12 transporter